MSRYILGVLMVMLLLAGCAGGPDTVEEAQPETGQATEGHEATAQEQMPEAGESPEPFSVDEKADAAQAAFAGQDYVRVLLLCSEIYANAPDLSFDRAGEVRLLHARTLYAMGDVKNGLPVLGKVVRDGLGGMAAVHAYVPWAADNGKAGEAAALLEGLLNGPLDSEKEPDPELFAALGWLYLKMGKIGLASERLDSVGSADDNAGTRMMVALARFEQGEYAKARGPAKDVWRQTRDPSALVLLGDLQRMEGRTAAAQRAYEQALKADPGHYGAMVSLGNLRMGQGDADGAARLFDQAAQALPERPEAWTNLGLSKRALGDFDGAHAAYRTALEKRMDFAPALKNIGILNEKYLGKPADAIPYYEKYIQVVGEDEEVQRWLKAANRLAGQGAR